MNDPAELFHGANPVVTLLACVRRCVFVRLRGILWRPMQAKQLGRQSKKCEKNERENKSKLKKVGVMRYSSNRGSTRQTTT
jgi:hypothetical protein